MIHVFGLFLCHAWTFLPLHSFPMTTHRFTMFTCACSYFRVANSAPLKYGTALLGAGLNDSVSIMKSPQNIFISPTFKFHSEMLDFQHFFKPCHCQVQTLLSSSWTSALCRPCLSCDFGFNSLDPRLIPDTSQFLFLYLAASGCHANNSRTISLTPPRLSFGQFPSHLREPLTDLHMVLEIQDAVIYIFKFLFVNHFILCVGWDFRS